MNIDWPILLGFALIGGITWGLSGIADCTRGCSHDTTVEYCLDRQLEMAKTSSSSVDLRCNR